jgi:hypothetical protein
MKPVKDHLLNQARGLIATADRERRDLTKEEKRQADDALERIREIDANEAWLEGRVSDVPADLLASKRKRDAEDAALKDQIDGIRAGQSAGNGGGFGAAVISAGFSLKAQPTVNVPASSILSKSTFPAAGDWNRLAPVTVPLGQDKRFLYPNLPTTDVNDATAIQDFRQTARTLTGSVQRNLDATTAKATVDATLALVTESLSQFAVTVNDVPNAILESVPLMTQFLNSEGRFQVEKAIDQHVFSQIVASAPPFGVTGTGLVAQLRNGIAAMRAEGANPSIAVVNATDAAALDLTADAGGYVFATRDVGTASPLFGLTIIERTSATNAEAPYLIDASMLGMLYLGGAKLEADPFSGFRANLTTLRVEVKGLMHIRNAKGARRLAVA